MLIFLSFYLSAREVDREPADLKFGWFSLFLSDYSSSSLYLKNYLLPKAAKFYMYFIFSRDEITEFESTIYRDGSQVFSY